MTKKLNLSELLGTQRKKTLRFSEFMAELEKSPKEHLTTSSSLISDAIKYFGFEIVVRSGEPIISYNIFKDLFSTGINAVFGQEFCIQSVVDVIESFEKESGPNRGIILVGPPASGKTNIIDLIARAVEEYSKQKSFKLYSFFFQFENEQGQKVEVHSSFKHNPILLFPATLQKEDGTIIRPRQELFNQINAGLKEKLMIPSYYQDAQLDKRTLDILESLRQNPANAGKSLFDIIEEYIRVEEVEFSNAQAKGLANIDDMRHLRVRNQPLDLGSRNMEIINEHVPGKTLFQYEGAIVGANRGILHVHDAFSADQGGTPESDYKPLLMLLGSGKVSIESTQASVDSTVIMTTNIEEMAMLERQLTASKLLDRIEKIPVNYLLDANAEMDILKRDMSNMREEYDVDPNLLKIAAYYSVMTRLLPPIQQKFPPHWSDQKKLFYKNLTPEQKLFIFASQSEDPLRTIQKLPHWHSFHNELLRLGLTVKDQDSISPHIVRHPNAINLGSCGLFTNTQLKLLDDEFMRTIWHEHYPNEGRSGISVRQLQNIMRNTIAKSDGKKIHVGIFLSQLRRIIDEGPSIHHWLSMEDKYKKDRKPVISRKIGDISFSEGEGDYGDFSGLVSVVRAIYYATIQREITVCTVDRDPEQIELDLRKYLQHALLARAIHNKAFSHVMVPKFTFIDPTTGVKVEEPDLNYMTSIEKILCQGNNYNLFRKEIAQKFLDMQSNGELALQEDKTIVNSKGDNLLECFSKEYNQLLSHRRVDEDLNPEIIRNAFFHMKNEPDKYENYGEKVQQFAETVIDNMSNRFGYSKDIALDTIVFALRKNIVSFDKILS